MTAVNGRAALEELVPGILDGWRQGR